MYALKLATTLHCDVGEWNAANSKLIMISVQDTQEGSRLRGHCFGQTSKRCCIRAARAIGPTTVGKGSDLTRDDTRGLSMAKGARMYSKYTQNDVVKKLNHGHSSPTYLINAQMF